MRRCCVTHLGEIFVIFFVYTYLQLLLYMYVGVCNLNTGTDFFFHSAGILLIYFVIRMLMKFIWTLYVCSYLPTIILLQFCKSIGLMEKRYTNIMVIWEYTCQDAFQARILKCIAHAINIRRDTMLSLREAAYDDIYFFSACIENPCLEAFVIGDVKTSFYFGVFMKCNKLSVLSYALMFQALKQICNTK